MGNQRSIGGTVDELDIGASSTVSDIGSLGAEGGKDNALPTTNKASNKKRRLLIMKREEGT
ncbi:MAG: hypothetical protein AAFO02_24450 [Bacteroidota bacterium]